MIVVDASFLLRLLINDPGTQAAERVWRTWRREHRPILAPSLMYYEISSVLHRQVRQGLWERHEALSLLSIIQDLRIERIDASTMHERAMIMAGDLNLPAAYDAHYLALAEQRRAEFWTADKKLARASQPRFPWVHLVKALDRSQPK